MSNEHDNPQYRKDFFDHYAVSAMVGKLSDCISLSTEHNLLTEGERESLRQIKMQLEPQLESLKKKLNEYFSKRGYVARRHG